MTLKDDEDTPPAQVLQDPRRETQPAIDRSELVRTKKIPAFPDPTTLEGIPPFRPTPPAVPLAPITSTPDDSGIETPPAGDPTLFNQFRVAFESLRTDVHGIVDGAAERMMQQIRRNADKSIQEHETTRRQIRGIDREVRQNAAMTQQLWDKVFGSEPPPDVPASDEPNAEPFAKERPTSPGRRTFSDIEEKTDELEEETDTLHGKLVVIDAKITDVKTEIIEAAKKEVKKIVEAAVQENNKKIDDLTALQKEQMGKRDPDDDRRWPRRFVDGLIWLVAEREGRRTLLLGISAAGIIYTAWHEHFKPEVTVQTERGASFTYAAPPNSVPALRTSSPESPPARPETRRDD